jgi:hypothetical protein
MEALCCILGLLSSIKWRILFNCKNFYKVFVNKCLSEVVVLGIVVAIEKSMKRKKYQERWSSNARFGYERSDGNSYPSPCLAAYSRARSYGCRGTEDCRWGGRRLQQNLVEYGTAGYSSSTLLGTESITPTSRLM